MNNSEALRDLELVIGSHLESWHTNRGGNFIHCPYWLDFAHNQLMHVKAIEYRLMTLRGQVVEARAVLEQHEDIIRDFVTGDLKDPIGVRYYESYTDKDKNAKAYDKIVGAYASLREAYHKGQILRAKQDALIIQINEIIKTKPDVEAEQLFI